MYPNPQAPTFEPSLNPQASVFQPTKSKPVYTKHMCSQIPKEVKMTQEGEWQLVESEGSDSKDYSSDNPKDADQNSQASSSTLIGPFGDSNNINRTKPAVAPIVTTAETHHQFQTQHPTHPALVQNHSSVYARAQASAEADADAYYQAYTQIDHELHPLLERQAEMEAQFQAQAQAQAQSHLHALVQITLSDGTVYMFPSHHTFWCYEHDGVYTIRTLASVMFRAEVGDWPGYWLRGQAAMGGSLIFVRT